MAARTGQAKKTAGAGKARGAKSAGRAKQPGAAKKAPAKAAAGKSSRAAKAAPARRKAAPQRHLWVDKYPEDVRWDFKAEARPLDTLLDDALEKYPHEICTNFLGKTLTYREIGGLVARAAKGLQGLGIAKGQKVGLFLPNCPYFPILYYAALRTGATVVNYNPLYAERELIFQIEDSETDVMVTLDLKVLFDKVATVARETRLRHVVVCKMADSLPGLKRILFPIVKAREIARVDYGDVNIAYADLIDNDGAYRPATIKPSSDIAVLQYTGGTTGVPKGAMLTHENLYANCMQVEQWFAYRDRINDRVIAILPFFHVYGMTAILNYGVYRGMEMILVPRFEAEDVLKTITSTRPNIMAGVPTMYNAFLNHPNLDKYDLSSLEYCSSGAAPLPVEVIKGWETLTGVRICEGYGLTETSPVATATPEHGMQKAGSIGVPCPGTVVKIVDIDNPNKAMPTGEKGELAITGPQVMKGYWKRPDATKDTIVGGKLLTGDIGYMDDDGYIFIVDRKKEMIIAGGYNIYPRNVEEVIYEHPAVEECAVVGVPDKYRGQTVKAYIKLRAGGSLTQEELTAFLEDKISAIEMPKIVEFRGDLPKSAIGKILKKELLAEEGV